METQLKLFDFPIDPLLEIRREISRIEESSHKVRRGCFAQIGKIGKSYIDLYERVHELEHKLWIMEKFIREHLHEKNNKKHESLSTLKSV